MTHGGTWLEFIDAARRSLQNGSELGGEPSPKGYGCPLQEFLSEGEVTALFAPPAAQSENLFGSQSPSALGFARLSDELRHVAALMRVGRNAEARSYLVARLDWLTDLRVELLNHSADTRFFIGLIDVVVGVREQLAEAA